VFGVTCGGPSLIWSGPDATSSSIDVYHNQTQYSATDGLWRGGRAVTEASGRISLETVAAIAANRRRSNLLGGGITHSAPILDLGLDIAD